MKHPSWRKLLDRAGERGWPKVTAGIGGAATLVALVTGLITLSGEFAGGSSGPSADQVALYQQDVAGPICSQLDHDLAATVSNDARLKVQIAAARTFSARDELVYQEVQGVLNEVQDLRSDVDGVPRLSPAFTKAQRAASSALEASAAMLQAYQSSVARASDAHELGNAILTFNTSDRPRIDANNEPLRASLLELGGNSCSLKPDPLLPYVSLAAVRDARSLEASNVTSSLPFTG